MLGFGAWIHTMLLSENTRLLLSVFLQVNFLFGEKMFLPIDSFQINADYHKMQIITKCQAIEMQFSAYSFLYASHSPPSPAGVWAMTEEYAFSIWNEVSPVVKPLCYSAVTLPLELFIFILRPSISFSARQAWIARALLSRPRLDGRGPECSLAHAAFMWLGRCSRAVSSGFVRYITGA